MADLPRLYLDEDVSVIVGELLRARGYDSVSTRDVNQLGATDEDQLAFAAGAERVLVTHNRVDFERLISRYFNDDIHHFGVIIAHRRFPNEMAVRILKALKGKNRGSLIDQVLYL
jgi:hypothetical protein